MEQVKPERPPLILCFLRDKIFSLQKISPLLICLSLFAPPLIAQQYTIQDLEVLEQNRDYKNFLDRANDIRPSERREPWPEMVRNMASGYIDFLTQRQDFSQEHFDYIEQLTTWPVLRQDEFFHLKWQRYGVRTLKRCKENALTSNSQEKREVCLNAIHRLWNSGTQNPDLGLQLAELTSQLNPKADLWRYYKVSTTSPVVSTYYCSRANIKRWAFRYLHLQIQERDLHGQELAQVISQNMTEDCWAHLKSDLERVLQGPRPQQISAFLLLEAKGALRPELKDFYLVRYFLEGPEVGRLFNLSWNRIEELSKSHTRRQAVLQKLLSLDPLPGKIFSRNLDSSTQEVLLNHLSRNFPEYLDGYFRTCLEYREGLKDFPRGNPTIECADLHQAQSEAQKEAIKWGRPTQRWIDQGLEIRFSAPNRP